MYKQTSNSTTASLSPFVSLQEIDPSLTQQTYNDCRSSLRIALQRKGLDSQTVEVMLAALAYSTYKQYNASLKYWWDFCEENAVDFFNPSQNEILRCLTKKFHENASYTSLNTMRSAIFLICDLSISKLDAFNRFFRGVFKLRPTKPKYDSTWDPEKVLSLIETWYPLENLPFPKMSKKLAILALGSGFRVQLLASILLKDIKITNKGVQIRISEIIKTSNPGAPQPTAFFPFFKEKKALCIASNLMHYLKITKDKRNKEKLLVGLQRSFNPVCSQTISRWINNVLIEAGIDKTYTAHSTRHASSSKALRQGLNINCINKAVGWSKNSKTFYNF